MVTQVLKLHLPAARAILRAWKTSPVPIYHEMHTRSYNFLYISTLSLWLALSPVAYLMITKDRKPVSQRLKNIESRIRGKDKSSFTIHAKKWPFTPRKKFRELLAK